MSEERQYRISDEAETIKFREQTNGALKVLELGNTLIHDCIDKINLSLTEFKMGLGKKTDDLQTRIEVHDDRLARIETSLGILVKVAWVVVVSSAGIVIAAFGKLVLR